MHIAAAACTAAAGARLPVAYSSVDPHLSKLCSSTTGVLSGCLSLGATQLVRMGMADRLVCRAKMSQLEGSMGIHAFM